MTDPAERRRWKLGRPSPALVVALLALFVSLSGTAVAAGVVPLAKHALTANTAVTAKTAQTAQNALKLGGLTAPQVGALASGPTIYVKTQPWVVAAGSDPQDFTTTCDTGEHVISGGFDNPDGNALLDGSHPSADGLSWVVNLGDLAPSDDAGGTLYAVCMR